MGDTTPRLHRRLVGGTVGLIASAALAGQAWKPPPLESYPSGWTVKTMPAPQAYDYTVGTGSTSLKATGSALPPPPDQCARVIYQMVPGGHCYPRITPFFSHIHFLPKFGDAPSSDGVDIAAGARAKCGPALSRSSEPPIFSSVISMGDRA